MLLPSQTNEFVTLGKISGVFGVKGWLKIYTYTDPREGILNYSPWYLKQGNSWTAIKVKAGHKQGKTLVAQLDNVDDRNLAERMIGLDIAVKASQLPHLGKNEYYWSDLTGLQVCSLDGKPFGRVDYVFATGANDVVVVKKDAGGECLIPFVKDDVIKSIDLAKATIHVDWDPEF